MYAGSASFSNSAARRGPQLPFLLHPLVQRHRLQLVLHLRPASHHMMVMLQQLPQIPLLHVGHPQPRKAIFQQQLQNVLRVPLVRLLPPHH